MSLFIHYHYHRIKKKVEEVGGKASFDYLSHWGFPSYVFNESFMPPNFKKKLKIVIENGEEFFVIIREKPEKPEKPFIHRCKLCNCIMNDDNQLKADDFVIDEWRLPELDDEDMLEGYDFYNDIELYEFKGHFKEFGPEFEYFDYSGTCRDCFFTKPLNLKVIKRPTLKSYNLTKKDLERLKKENSEIRHKIDFPSEGLGFIEYVIFQKEEKMREKYLDEYKEWIRNNENYILYDKHLIEWENYTNELYKYEHSKQKYDYAIEKEKEKIELEKTKKFWNSLDGIEFEKNIGELFKNLGRKVEFTSVTGDQGVDLFIGKDTVVQCKAHEAQISPSVIREMYGSMIHFKKKKAIVISTGGFTKGCYDFAKGKPIELWDLDKIIEKAKSIRR